jgi:hypothetical protein
MKVSGAALLVSQPDGKATLEVAGRPMFELNPAAALICKNLAVGLPIQEIIGQLAGRFNIPEERAASDVSKFIELLKRHLLLVDDAQLTGDDGAKIVDQCHRE